MTSAAFSCDIARSTAGSSTSPAGRRSGVARARIFSVIVIPMMSGLRLQVSISAPRCRVPGARSRERCGPPHVTGQMIPPSETSPVPQVHSRARRVSRRVLGQRGGGASSAPGAAESRRQREEPQRPELRVVDRADCLAVLHCGALSASSSERMAPTGCARVEAVHPFAGRPLEQLRLEQRVSARRLVLRTSAPGNADPS